MRGPLRVVVSAALMGAVVVFGFAYGAVTALCKDTNEDW